MRYEGMIYRPPSEARSMILQVTVGCAHNDCTFCTMYKDKKFHIRDKKEIFEDLDYESKRNGNYPFKVFLADGDALVLPTSDLLEIIAYIYKRFPKTVRITSYATAQDILRKSDEDLKALHDAGLEMVYVGAESGDPEILKRIKKDVTCEELIAASQKLKKSGIQMSLTLISGLGGQERKVEHALESAKLVSAMKPEYLGFLTLMLEEGAPILEDIYSGKMKLLRPYEVLDEMRMFLQNVDSEGTVFRANHASNYIILKGTLNQDTPKMLAYLDEVEKREQYRDESWRAL